MLILKTTRREILSLLLVAVGLCTGIALILPSFTGEPVTVRRVKLLLAGSLFFLGMGCGVLTKNRLCYAVAAFGVVVAATI